MISTKRRFIQRAGASVIRPLLGDLARVERLARRLAHVRGEPRGARDGLREARRAELAALDEGAGEHDAGDELAAGAPGAAEAHEDDEDAEGRDREEVVEHALALELPDVAGGVDHGV